MFSKPHNRVSSLSFDKKVMRSVTIFLEIYKLFLDKKELGKIDFV